MLSYVTNVKFMVFLLILSTNSWYVTNARFMVLLILSTNSWYYMLQIGGSWCYNWFLILILYVVICYKWQPEVCGAYFIINVTEFTSFSYSKYQTTFTCLSCVLKSSGSRPATYWETGPFYAQVSGLSCLCGRCALALGSIGSCAICASLPRCLDSC